MTITAARRIPIQRGNDKTLPKKIMARGGYIAQVVQTTALDNFLE